MRTGIGMIKKLGAVLAFTLEETEYYESIKEMYRDILDVMEEMNDQT